MSLLPLILTILLVTAGCGAARKDSFEGAMHEDLLKISQDSLREGAFEGYELSISEFEVGDTWRIIFHLKSDSGDQARIVLEHEKMCLSIASAEGEERISWEFLGAVTHLYDFWYPYAFNSAVK